MLRNFVEEAANNPGTASVVSLNGAPTGRQSWRSAGFPSGSPVFYEMADGVQFEWGLGIVTLGTPDTLTRQTVKGNSNGTLARLNFSGACRVYCEMLAEHAVYLDSNGNVSADAKALSTPFWGGAATGTENALAVSVSPAPPAMAAGLQVVFQGGLTNTGPVTLNLNGLGAYPIVKMQQDWPVNMGAGDIHNNSPVHCYFDGANWRMLSPPRSSETPVGAVIDYSANTLPSGYLFADGRNVSRTLYPRLAQIYALDGFPYGAGDGSTTFGIPDLRGRVTVSKDTGAGRVTVGGAGFAGGTLGAAGGSEWLMAHGHGMNDPGHAHGIYDAGHAHGVADPGHNHYVNDPGHLHGGATAGAGDHAHTVAAMGGGGGGGPGDFANVYDIQDRPTTTAGNHAHSIVTDTRGTGLYLNGAGTGIGIYGAGTGVAIYSAGTGTYVNNAGAGGSQNMPPAMVMNKLVYAGH